MEAGSFFSRDHLDNGKRLLDSARNGRVVELGVRNCMPQLEFNRMILQFRCLEGETHPIIGKVWHQFPSCVAEGGERYDRYLCSALFMTMHTSDDCMEALELLDSVQSGQSDVAFFGLNDTEITFTNRGAQIDILIEDESGTTDGLFDLLEFRKAIVAWNDFLRQPCTHEHVFDVDIC
jgi:hypothetical protein